MVDDDVVGCWLLIITIIFLNEQWIWLISIVQHTHIANGDIVADIEGDNFERTQSEVNYEYFLQCLWSDM